MRVCRITRLSGFAVLVLAIVNLAPTAATPDQAITRYQALANEGVLDSTYADILITIGRSLTAVSGRFSNMAVNSAPRPGTLTILVAPVTLDGLSPDPALQAGNFSSLPGTNLIFVDKNYLDQLRAAATIYARQRDVKIRDIAQVIMLDGPEIAAAQYLGNGADWRSRGDRLADGLFDGAVAFLLAHEMGHLILNHPLPLRFQVHSSVPTLCGEFRGPQSTKCRKLEVEADVFATGLITKVILQPPFRPILHYDIGTHFLMEMELARMTDKLAAALEPDQIAVLPPSEQARLKTGTTQRLRARPGSADFKKILLVRSTHPAWAFRLFNVLESIAHVPNSIYYNDLPDPGDRTVLTMLLDKVCPQETADHP